MAPKEKVSPKGLGDCTPVVRHALQVKFARHLDTLKQNEPEHEFLTKWSKMHGRKERNEIIAKWVANNYELSQEIFRTKAEKFEDTKGLSGETFPREALVSMWGETRADTFIANCKAISHKFPELVTDDPLLGCKVYMYSKMVVKALRSTLDAVNSESRAKSHNSSGSSGSAGPATPIVPAEEVHDVPREDVQDVPPAPDPMEAELATADNHDYAIEAAIENYKRPKVVKRFKRKLADVFAEMPPDCDWEQLVKEILQEQTQIGE
jgi:hypothetical protein